MNKHVDNVTNTIQKQETIWIQTGLDFDTDFI